jgi:hypothetical protein
MAYDKLSTYKTFWDETDTGGSVMYQRTHIVTWTDKVIKLNSDGWESVTTKRKMNQSSHQFNLNYSVSQTDFAWYVTQPNGETVPYYDKMIINRK